MKYKVITITREFGSGGRTIGRAVADELGYDFYDYELVKKAAEESGMAEEYVEKHGEDANGRSLLSFMWNNAGGSVSDLLYIAQRTVIQNLAEKGNCVIVGRCADYILRDRDDVFNIFIKAQPEFKQKRIVEKYGERPESPEKRVNDKDKRRIAYYKYYTGRKWGDADNYELCLDSGVIGVEKCIDLIVNVLK